MRPAARGWRRPAAVALSAAVLGSGLLALGGAAILPTAQAAPGSPGVPGDPILLFEEDFENRAPGSNILLSDYIGADGTTYTADANWIDRARCNGFIIDSTSPRIPPDCDDPNGNTDGAQPYSGLTKLVYALGVVGGSADPAANAAASSYTSGDPGGNLVQFRTVDPLSLPTATGRFVTFSVDAAATSCWEGASPPLLRFYLEDGQGTEIPVSDSPINPCAQGEVVPVPGEQDIYFAGSFAADSSYLVTGGTLGIVLRNENPSGSGNDGAYDNIRVLDATPQLDKSFEPASVPVGGVSTLTLTVTNTSDLAAKSGWGFTDALPDGLVVADPANIGGSCDATTVATPGGSDIVITDGNLAAGEVSCTITVDVTSETPRGADPSPKVYENCAANIEDPVGIDLPGCAEVEFYSTPTLLIEKTSDATGEARPGDVVTYTVTATNVGDGDYTENDPAVVLDDLTGVLDDADYNDDADASRPGPVSYAEPLLSWSGPLPVDESVTLTYSVTLLDSGDGIVRNVAWSPEDPENPQPPACDPPEDGVDPDTGEPCAEHEYFLPKLEVDKTADPETGSTVVAGQEVAYTLTFRNVGEAIAPVDYTDDLADVLDDATLTTGPAPSDPALTAATGADDTIRVTGSLAPDQTVTVTYTVTVKSDGERGDNLLGNVLAETGNPGPECGDLDVWCTEHPVPELVSWKTVDPDESPVAAGTVLTYTLYFENLGEASGTVDEVDDLTHVLDDAEVTTEPSSPDGLAAVRNGERISITGDVPAGEIFTVTYQVTVKADDERGDDIAANFLLAPDEEPPTEPVCQPEDHERPDCTVTPIGRLLTSKSVSASSDPVVTGTVLTYTLTFDNQGEDSVLVDHTDVLTDVLDDADLTSDPVPSDPVLTVSDVADGAFTVTGELAAGQVVTVTYQVTVKDEAGRGNDSADNFLIETGTAPPEQCEDTDPNCTETPLPNIVSEKHSDPETGSTVLPGQEVTYTLTFTNTGEAAGPVDYSDHLDGVLDDAELTTAPVPSDPALNVTSGADGIIRVTGTLQPDQTVSVTYTVTVKADGERGDHLLGNVLVETGTTPPEECEDGDPNCTEHPVPLIVDHKSVDPASGTPVVAGQELTYTLTFTNEGRATGTVDRVDDLTHVLDDAELVSEPVASDESWTVTRDGHRVAITGELGAGDTVTVTYTVRVKPTGDRGDDILANFLVDPDEEPPTEPVCEPDEDEGPDCTVNPVGDIRPGKSVDPESGTTVGDGDVLTYTLSFENTGEGAATLDYTDHLADVLDDAVFLGVGDVSDGLAVEGPVDGALHITGTVGPGETATVTYQVEVEDRAEQGDHHLRNFVVVTGEEPPVDCVPENPLCTENPTEEPDEPSDPNLPDTGTGMTVLTLTVAMLLLGAGAGVLLLTRRRRLS